MARVEGGAVIIDTDWPGLKNQIDTRNINFKYEEDATAYEIFAIDGQYFYKTIIYKSGQAPQDQGNHDTWRAQFEADYKNKLTDFNSTQPFFLSNEDGYGIVIQDGYATSVADGYGIAAIGSDGSNYRMIKTDTSGRQVSVGAGTAGSPVGGVISIQGVVGGTSIPISGSITADNASVGANDGAIPGFSTLIAGSDGTNLRPVRSFDLDTGGGQQWILGVGLRKASGGGSVELGTSSDPIRIDPTGTTTQPISGTVTANQGGAWTVSGSGNFTVIQPTASSLRAQLASESNIGSAITSTALLVGGSDGTNLRPVFMDSSGRQIVIGGAANGAAVAGNPVLIAGSDGTNARSVRTANDGTIRVDPTGTTVQPISISGANIDTGNSSTTPLSGGASFTGTGFDTAGYATVGVSVFANQAGTLNLQFSSDNTNWDESISYTVPASDHVRVTTGPQSRYFRVNYVNGGSAQATFRLQTIEKPVGSYPSTVPVDTVISASDDAIITKSVITGKTTGGGGGYVDVKVNPSGTLTVDISNSTNVGITGTVTSNQGTSPWVTNITQFGSSNVVTGTGASGSGIPRVTVANDSNILATQSGTWTVQPGNTANTTPWLATINQGGNSATVTASNALKVDGSAVTQPVSSTQLPSSLVGGRLDTNIGAWLGSTAPTVGQKTMTNSVPIVISSDQTAIPVSQSGTWTVQQGTPPWSVVGAAADGAAVTGNPVRIAGSDGTNTQDITTDTSGRLLVSGAAADGAAVTGNPVLIGGQDGTNAQSILTDTAGRQVIVGAAADGAAVAGNPILIGGTDGTNAQTAELRNTHPVGDVQGIIVRDIEVIYPTFHAVFDRISPAANKYMATLWNGASGRKVVVQRVWRFNWQVAAVSGTSLDQELRKITARTAGTSVTPIALDSSDTLTSGIAADHNSSSVTDGVLLQRPIAVSEERDALDTRVVDWLSLTPFALIYERKQGTRGIVLRQNEGLSFKNITSSTVGTVSYVIEFTDEVA